MTLYTTSTIRYYRVSVTAWVDAQIGYYYRALTPKYLNIQPTKYDSHISIVRYFNTVDRRFWGAYEGKQFVVWYNTDIKYEAPYFFLDCWSDGIAAIRQELGLPIYPLGRDCYHITIGNDKCQTQI